MDVSKAGEALHFPVESTMATYDETVDPDEATPAFLAPRLAAYAQQDEDEEDTESSADAGSGLAVVSGNDEEEEGQGKGLHHSGGPIEVDDETDEASPGPTLGVVDQGEGETYDYDDSADDAVEEEREDEEQDGGQYRADDFTGVFPVSRVKDLLKFEGSSAVISRDACLAASEAVALILRDMTKNAAAEAQRRHRKTVTYDDIARTVQLFDRFAYLSEVVPPPSAPASGGLNAPTTTTTTSGVVLTTRRETQKGGVHRGDGARGDRQQQPSPQGTSGKQRLQEHKKNHVKAQGKGSLEEGNRAAGSGAAVHPIILPGADVKRQTTLRF